MTLGDREASVAMEGEDARRIRRTLVGAGVDGSDEQGDAVPDAESLDSDESRSKFWFFCFSQ